MKYFRGRKIVPIDYDHMKILHEECIEQLELMKVSLESAQLSSDMMRDRLDDMASQQWRAYIDVIHLLCIHDDRLNAQIQKTGMDLRAEDDERQYQTRRILLLSLLSALICHHRRVVCIYQAHGDTIKDYLNESSEAERVYIASIIEMVHKTL